MVFPPAQRVIRRPSPVKAGRLLAQPPAEPSSVRTGRALTGAVRRIFGSQGGNTTKAAQRAAFAIMGASSSIGSCQRPGSRSSRSANRNGRLEARLT